MRVFDGIDFHSNDGQGGRLSDAIIETKKGISSRSNRPIYISRTAPCGAIAWKSSIMAR